MQDVSKFAEEWNYSKQTVQKWCRTGKIPGAEQDAPNHPWRIPDDAVPPNGKKGTKKKK